MKQWWRPRSVRVRLTLWYAGALAVVLVLYAGGVFAFLRHRLSAELDYSLHEDFEVAEQMLELTGNGGVRWRAENDHHDEEDLADDGWLAVWNTQGTLLYQHSPDERENAEVISPPP